MTNPCTTYPPDKWRFSTNTLALVGDAMKAAGKAMDEARAMHADDSNEREATDRILAALDEAHFAICKADMYIRLTRAPVKEVPADD